MSRRDDTAALRHMLDYARTALRLVGNHQRADLNTDEMLRLALTRAVEVVGEAAFRVDDRTKSENPGVPWGQIVGTRNRLIHGYDSVDLDILWTIVVGDLPGLVKQIESILNSRSG